jgi:Tfp pilus assembly protein PilF
LRVGYLSVGYLLEKKWERALPSLDQVLSLDPSDIEMRLYRAQALMSLNRKQEARTEFETVLNKQPDNKQARKGLDLLAQYY